MVSQPSSTLTLIAPFGTRLLACRLASAAFVTSDVEYLSSGEINDDLVFHFLGAAHTTRVLFRRSRGPGWLVGNGPSGGRPDCLAGGGKQAG